LFSLVCCPFLKNKYYSCEDYSRDRLTGQQSAKTQM
jgi:hypothetical protein